jgi:hypothetical protein
MRGYDFMCLWLENYQVHCCDDLFKSFRNTLAHILYRLCTTLMVGANFCYQTFRQLKLYLRRCRILRAFRKYTISFGTV